MLVRSTYTNVYIFEDSEQIGRNKEKLRYKSWRKVFECAIVKESIYIL